MVHLRPVGRVPTVSKYPWFPDEKAGAGGTRAASRDGELVAESIAERHRYDCATVASCGCASSTRAPSMGRVAHLGAPRQAFRRARSPSRRDERPLVKDRRRCAWCREDLSRMPPRPCAARTRARAREAARLPRARSAALLPVPTSAPPRCGVRSPVESAARKCASSRPSGGFKRCHFRASRVFDGPRAPG